MTAFIQKVARKKSVDVFEFSDIERMRSYQQELINSTIYEPPMYNGGQKNHLLIAKMHAEISEIEVWLKSMTNDFILNNAREFKS